MTGLLKCKGFVHELIESGTSPRTMDNLSDGEWTIVEKLVSVMKVPYIATKMLQTTNFTISDFHGEWRILKCEVKAEAGCSNEQNDYAKQLLLSIDKYSGQLLSNPMYVAAVFLDPRFTKTLNLNQRTLAISKLMKIHQRVKEGENTSRTDPCANKESNRLDLLEALIAEECDDVVSQTELSEREIIHRLLVDFAELPREKVTVNVLEYWNRNRETKVELFKLSQIVYAAAPTQTPTESSFSKLGHIFSSRRTKIKDKLLEDILIVNLNKDLFYKITEFPEE